MRYPKSFSTLLALGFALVAVPLIIALVNNAVAVDRLAAQSRAAVRQAVQATAVLRELAEKLTELERAVRQYAVLADASTLDTYEGKHRELLAIAQRTQQLGPEGGQRQRLTRILDGVERLHAAIESRQTLSDADIEEQFKAFSAIAAEMNVANTTLIDREVRQLQSLAARAQLVVGWQLLAALPVAVFLVVGLTILLNRPIRQLERGIRQLGAARFEESISVGGPEDLQHLGDQLDWLRQRLAELDEQKARFIHHVSHELKTPLTALREGSDLLAEGAAGGLSAEQREIVRILQDNSHRLKRQIEDLLTYSAVARRESRVTFKPVRMRTIIESVLEDHKLALLAKEIAVERDLDDVDLEGDEEKLRVVFDNLVSNAIKFTPHGGRIRVAVRRADDAVTIEVVDTGPGVAPEDRGHVFEAFYQGRNRGSGPVRGSGLGLSIVKELVEAHGGMVQLLDSPGAGAHFAVRLPLPAAAGVKRAR